MLASGENLEGTSTRRKQAEWSIKPFVIDRKNFLFANTPKGASCSVQPVLENGLDPYRYPTWFIKAANNANLSNPETVQNPLT